MKSNTHKIKTILKLTELLTTVKKEMWLLSQQFYTTTEYDFYQQLKTYDYCVFFRCSGQMIGFVGIQVQRTTLKGKRYLFLRLGVATILEQFRGKGLLQVATLKISSLYWKDVLAGRVFCWGNTFTYKSYLVFAKSVDIFYPNYQEATPYTIKDLMDFLGTQHFSRYYEKTHGIIKNVAQRLRDNSDKICYKYKEEPHIRFFSEINPYYEAGDGLITVAPMNRKNIISLLKKVVQLNWRTLSELWNADNRMFYTKSLFT